MATSTVIKHLYDGSVTFTDGDGVPTSLSVLYTQGDLSVSGLGETLNAVTAYETRGTLHSVRHTSRTYPSGSLSLMMADLSDGTDNTPLDFLLQQGSYSSLVSTLGASAEVFAVQITLTIEGTDHGDSADHTIVLDDCVCTVDASEGEPNMLTVNFTCYGSVTFT